MTIDDLLPHIAGWREVIDARDLPSTGVLCEAYRRLNLENDGRCPPGKAFIGKHAEIVLLTHGGEWFASPMRGLAAALGRDPRDAPAVVDDIVGPIGAIVIWSNYSATLLSGVYTPHPDPVPDPIDAPAALKP